MISHSLILVASIIFFFILWRTNSLQLNLWVYYMCNNNYPAKSHGLKKKLTDEAVKAELATIRGYSSILRRIIVLLFNTFFLITKHSFLAEKLAAIFINFCHFSPRHTNYTYHRITGYLFKLQMTK